MPTRRNTSDISVAPAAPVTYKCRFCGTKFPVPHHGKRGRPPEHCSQDCREASAALNVLEKWLAPVAKRATVDNWQSIRHRLWGLANASPVFQRAMSARASERRAAIASVPEALARRGKGASRPAYVVTIGTTRVSDDAYASEAEAAKVARAFSATHPGILVDVRTAVAKEKRRRYRDGKAAPIHRNPRSSGR